MGSVLRALLSALFWIGVGVFVTWLLLGHGSLLALFSGRLLDWIMGILCFVWLLVILKAPWDLFFQARSVAFELQRARERSIEPQPGREDYVEAVGRRLLVLAVVAHLLSAGLVAAISYYSGGAVGYYFAVLYLVSTVFRPALAGYEYLRTRLQAIGQEALYPREDVVALREKFILIEAAARENEDYAEGKIYHDLGSLSDRLNALREELVEESHSRSGETRELRESIHAVGRELEVTVSRLTDNQDVIRGVQAFVRLIQQSGAPGTA